MLTSTHDGQARRPAPTRRALLAALLLLAGPLGNGGCGADSLTVRLLLPDPPEPDPLANVATVRLSVRGDGLDEVTRDAPRESSEISLPEIPYGAKRVIKVEGLDQASKVLSRGESEPFDFSEDGPDVVEISFARVDCAKAYYPDDDGDGFGVSSGKVLRCVAPPRSATADGDCDDKARDVNPGQASYFETAGANGFDYNCDGNDEPELGDVADCRKRGGKCSGDGWQGSVPACGASGTYVTCDDSGSPCGQTTATRVQRCR